MELKRYFRIILHWWWLVLISTVMVTTASFVFSFSQIPRYSTSLTMVVSPKAAINEYDTLRQSLDTLDKASVINTYSAVIQSRDIYDQAQNSLNLQAGERDSMDVIATVMQKTNMIVIEVQGTNPAAVQQMANQIAAHSIEYINDLYELYDIKILDPAPLPAEPYTPDVVRDTALGAVLGLMLGIGLSFLAEYLQKPTGLFETMTIIDPDTGLYNRWYFMQRLREELSRLRRGQHGLAVCLIEVRYQDNLQQLAPQPLREALYRQVFLFMKQQMRQGEILTLWEKDHLAWLMLDVNEEVVQLAIQRMRNVKSRADFRDESSGGRLQFEFFYGVALAPKLYSDDERTLMALADQALERAQRSEAKGFSLLVAEVAEDQPAQTQQPQHSA